MIIFKEFFVEFHNLTNPHHRNRSLTRGNEFTRDGQYLGKANMIADRYKINNANYDQNKNQKTGPISNNEAEELISKHNIKSFPARLGKRPFMLIKTPTGYSIQKIN